VSAPYVAGAVRCLSLERASSAVRRQLDRSPTQPRAALRKKKSKKQKKEKKEKKSKKEKSDADSKELQAAAEFIEEEVVDAKSYEEIQSSVCPSLTDAHTSAEDHLNLKILKDHTRVCACPTVFGVLTCSCLLSNR
jgi:hypothetical protein